MDEVIGFISRVWRSLVNLLTPAEKVAVAFSGALMHGFAEQLGPVGMQIVTDVIKAVEAAGGNGGDKRKAAFAAISKDLEQAMIIAVPQIIYGAIEAAVAEMNHLKNDAQLAAMTQAAGNDGTGTASGASAAPNDAAGGSDGTDGA